MTRQDLQRRSNEIRSPKEWILGFLLTMVLLPLSIQVSTAQSPLSKVVGSVSDQGGGVVAGAAIKVQHENLGYTRSATTDETGYYEVGQLPDGLYTVEVEHPGFKTFARQQIVLGTRQTVRIDAMLSVGEVTEKIVVQGEAPAISTDTAEIDSSIVNRRVLENNPFNMVRNFDIAWGQYLSPSIQINHAVGTTSTQNRGTVDGLEVMSRSSMAHETVQEVKILTSGTQAEYSTPAIIDFVTQSGTNTFHGKYLIQLSNPALNALGPNATARGPGWPTNKDQMVAFSGPVWIPKVYNGRDKTFFYFDREWISGATYIAGWPGVARVPATSMRRGDFSFLPASAFRTGSLVNPFTGDSLPNNQIPSAMINQLSRNLQSFIPDPNTGSGLDEQNFRRDSTIPVDVSSAFITSIKVDHQLTSKDRIGWASTRRDDRYTWDASETNFFWEKINAPVHNHRVYWTHIFNPQVINEFRAGIERIERDFGPDPNPPFPVAFTGDGAEFMKTAGFTWIPDLDTAQRSSIPGINIAGYATGIFFRGGNLTKIDRRHFTNNLTWIHKNHSIKIGGDIRPAYNSTISWDRSTAGQFRFTGRFSGHPVADFLLGLPDNSSRTGVLPKPYRQQAWGGLFVQDSWRFSPRLNFELGLRFEHLGLPHEKNHMMSNFDPDTGSIVVPDDAAKSLVSPAFPSTIPVLTADQAGFPLLLRERPQIHWYPRIGFAYRPQGDERSVVRASFGMFSVPPSDSAESAMVTTSPFALNEAFSNSVGNGVAAFSFPNPFPPSAGSVPGQNATAVAKSFPWGYTQNWNLTLERELAANTGLRLSYIGTKGTRLPYQRWISPVIGGTTIYPNFGRVSLADAGARMNHHGMEVALTRRYAAGIQGQVFYSWGHKHNTGDDTKLWASSTAGDLGGFIEDSRSRDRDYGRSWLWSDQRLVISHVIDLPFGKGRRFLSDSSMFDYLLGGWSLTGMYYFSTWAPLNPLVAGQDPLGLGRNIRPNVIAGCNPSIQPTIQAVFNASCFERPIQGQYGNAGRNVILPQSWTGLGNNFFSLYKEFKLTPQWAHLEQARLRIGAKAANLFNHPYLLAFPEDINTLIGSPTAAQGRQVGARQLQFDVKLEF